MITSRTSSGHCHGMPKKKTFPLMLFSHLLLHTFKVPSSRSCLQMLIPNCRNRSHPGPLQLASIRQAPFSGILNPGAPLVCLIASPGHGVEPSRAVIRNGSDTYFKPSSLRPPLKLQCHYRTHSSVLGKGRRGRRGEEEEEGFPGT